MLLMPGLAWQAKGGLRNYIGLQRETPPWHKRLTSQFDNDTRLVGPTISCEGTPYQGDPNGEWRAVPHVQSHAIAVDQVRRYLQPNRILLSAARAAHNILAPAHQSPSQELKPESLVRVPRIWEKHTHSSVGRQLILAAGGAEGAAGRWQCAEVSHKPLGQQVVCGDRGFSGCAGERIQHRIPDEEVSTHKLAAKPLHVSWCTAMLTSRSSSL